MTRRSMGFGGLMDRAGAEPSSVWGQANSDRPSLAPAFNVWAPGAKVQVGGDIPAVILGFSITGQAVQYRVEWWDNRSRHDEWLTEDSVVGLAGQPSVSVIYPDPFMGDEEPA